MKIVNFVKDSIVYYDDKKADRLVFMVSEYFWEHLSSVGIQYRSGVIKKNAAFTEKLNLKPSDADFPKVFSGIANSAIGKKLLTGELPPDTVM